MGKYIAIIPARSGSKGVPDKNIKPLAGKPLLAYSIAAARATNGIDRVIVSTDSTRYADIAREYGAEVPFLRPAEYSGDRVGDYPVIKHALDWLKKNENSRPQLIVHLRPTSPLREPSYIDEAIKLFKTDEKATALRSVQEMPESAYKTFEVENNHLKCLCSGSFDVENANLGRQVYPKTFQANGYVDILRSSFVIKNKKIHGNQVLAFITPPMIEVDTIEDFHYLEYQAGREQALIAKLFKPEKS